MILDLLIQFLMEVNGMGCVDLISIGSFNIIVVRKLSWFMLRNVRVVTMFMDDIYRNFSSYYILFL